MGARVRAGKYVRIRTVATSKVRYRRVANHPDGAASFAAKEYASRAATPPDAFR
jgi:hypothetical protein